VPAGLAGGGLVRLEELLRGGAWIPVQLLFDLGRQLGARGRQRNAHLGFDVLAVLKRDMLRNMALGGAHDTRHQWRLPQALLNFGVLQESLVHLQVAGDPAIRRLSQVCCHHRHVLGHRVRDRPRFIGDDLVRIIDA
jgi:hypothetical protein